MLAVGFGAGGSKQLGMAFGGVVVVWDRWRNRIIKEGCAKWE